LECASLVGVALQTPAAPIFPAGNQLPKFGAFRPGGRMVFSPDNQRKGKRMKALSVFQAAAVTALIAAALPASAQNQPKVGTLRCEVSGGLGLIISSSKEMECVFRSAHGRTEHDFGAIRKFGLDIGATTRGVLAWDVFAPTVGPGRGALAGTLSRAV
jgi:hypothetical protein